MQSFAFLFLLEAVLMPLALVRLESPAGSVFKNGTENLNGIFVLQKSVILAVLVSKFLSSCRMESVVGGRLCCCFIIFVYNLCNPEVVGMCFAHLFFHE